MESGLRSIPQDLDFLQYDEGLDSEYRKLYLPESEQKKRVLTYKIKN